MRARFARTPFVLAPGLLILFCLLMAPTKCAASEIVSVSDTFRIHRNFSKIVFPTSETPRVFVDPIKMVSREENSSLHKIAVDALSARLEVVPDKQGADYLVQIIMQQQTDFAIRNPKGDPARAYILISICKLPVTTEDVAINCENLTYFYFRVQDKKTIFTKALNMWLDSIKPTIQQ